MFTQRSFKSHARPVLEQTMSQKGVALRAVLKNELVRRNLSVLVGEKVLTYFANWDHLQADNA